MIEIEESIALDDSGQMQLWARGHVPWGDFVHAVMALLRDGQRSDIPEWVIVQAPVRHLYQRQIPRRGSAVSDSQFLHQETPGQGATPVTVLDFWLPLHPTMAPWASMDRT